MTQTSAGKTYRIDGRKTPVYPYKQRKKIDNDLGNIHSQKLKIGNKNSTSVSGGPLTRLEKEFDTSFKQAALDTLLEYDNFPKEWFLPHSKTGIPLTFLPPNLPALTITKQVEEVMGKGMMSDFLGLLVLTKAGDLLKDLQTFKPQQILLSLITKAVVHQFLGQQELSCELYFLYARDLERELYKNHKHFLISAYKKNYSFQKYIRRMIDRALHYQRS